MIIFCLNFQHYANFSIMVLQLSVTGELFVRLCCNLTAIGRNPLLDNLDQLREDWSDKLSDIQKELGCTMGRITELFEEHFFKMPFIEYHVTLSLRERWCLFRFELRNREGGREIVGSIFVDGNLVANIVVPETETLMDGVKHSTLKSLVEELSRKLNVEVDHIRIARSDFVESPSIAKFSSKLCKSRDPRKVKWESIVAHKGHFRARWTHSRMFERDLYFVPQQTSRGFTSSVEMKYNTDLLDSVPDKDRDSEFSSNCNAFVESLSCGIHRYYTDNLQIATGGFITLKKELQDNFNKFWMDNSEWLRRRFPIHEELSATACLSYPCAMYLSADIILTWSFEPSQYESPVLQSFQPVVGLDALAFQSLDVRWTPSKGVKKSLNVVLVYGTVENIEMGSTSHPQKCFKMNIHCGKSTDDTAATGTQEVVSDMLVRVHGLCNNAVREHLGDHYINAWDSEVGINNVIIPVGKSWGIFTYSSLTCRC